MLDIKKRSSGRFKSDISNKDIYKYYKRNIKPVESLNGVETKGSFNVTQKEFTDILKDVNKSIINIIVKENFEFKLPCRLGTILMKQAKVRYKVDDNGNLRLKNLSIDYKATRDLWDKDDEARINKQVVYHTNEHTNGNRMAYWWKKGKSPSFGCVTYYFLACREMKRTPAKLLKDKELGLMFFEVNKDQDRNELIFRNKNRV